MKKFAIFFIALILTFTILPCAADDVMSVAPTEPIAPDAPTMVVPPTDPIAPDTPVSSTPAEALPEQEDIPLIGEAFVGTDAPIAPSPDTPIEHPIAPDAGDSYEGKDILLIAPAPGEEIVTDGALAVAPEIAPSEDMTEDDKKEKKVVNTIVDKHGNIILIMEDGTTMNGGKAEEIIPESEGNREFKFEPQNFAANLGYMGAGMLGIFIVIGIIVLSTVVLNKLFREKSDKAQ